MLLTSLLLASCMPDSLTKYKEDSKKAASTNTTGGSSGGSGGSSGSGTVVREATTLTCSNTNIQKFYLGTSIPDQTVTTNGEGALSYTLTITTPSNASVSSSINFLTGLNFDTESGKISGTPTKASTQLNYKVSLYQNNIFKKDCTFKFSAATKLEAGDLFLAHSTTDDNNLLMIKVDKIDDFEKTIGENTIVGGVGPGEEQAYGSVSQIDEDEKTLYVNFDDSLYSESLDNIFQVGSKLSIDNDGFGFTDDYATIEKVIYVKKSISTAFRISPAYSRDISFGAGEQLTYTITRGSDPDVTDKSLATWPNIIARTSCTGVPSDGKIYYETSTGDICAEGTTTTPLKSFSPRKYVLTARNANKETVSFEFYFSVQEEPENLSTGEFLLLEMTSTDKFSRGMQISGTCDTIVPPEVSYAFAEESRGIVKEIIRKDLMVVKVTKGDFAINAKCASGKIPIANKIPYTGETAKAISVKAITGSIVVADMSNFSIGEVVTTSGGAVGVVVARDDLSYITSTYNSYNPTRDKVYLKVISGNFTTGQTVEGQSILAADFPNVVLAVGSSASFKRGSDVVGDDADVVFNSNNSSGTITSLNGNSLYVESHFDFYSPADNIDNANPFAAAETSITSVASDNHFNLYLGQEAYIKLDLQKGNNIRFALDGEPPAGLKVDLSTLSISGTPTDFTEAGERRSYTISAYNATNAASPEVHTFTIQIHNHFTLGYDIEDSKTSRYLLHRAKYGNKTRACSITEDMIDIYKNSLVSGPVDTSTNIIDCFLDAEEVDLYSKGVALTTEIGGGLCARIEFEPYSIFQYPAGNSTTTALDDDAGEITGNFDSSFSRTERCYFTHSMDGTAFASGCSNLPSGSLTPDYDCDGVLDAEDGLSIMDGAVCAYNYTSDPDIQKNCDEGIYKETPIEWVVDGDASNTCQIGVDTTTSGSPTQRECGGIHQHCLAGAATDFFSVEELADKALEYFDEDIIDGRIGINKIPWTLVAPITKGHFSNIGIANYAANNSCGDPTETNDNYTYLTSNWKRANYDARSTLADGSREKFQDPFHQANPVYTFRCERGDGLALATINLFIREFDTTPTVNNSIDQYLGDDLVLASSLAPFRDLANDDVTLNSRNDRASVQDLYSSGTNPGICPTPASIDAEADGTVRYSFPGLGL
jgi:hypothetical protein